MTPDFKLSFFKFFSPLIKHVVHEDFDETKIILHSDFSNDWYKTAASNIIMIGAISFNLSAIGILIFSIFRRKVCHYFAKKQKLQIQMKQWLKGISMEIEYIYGAVLTVIYYTLLFGSNLPLNYMFTFISLIILYWSHKYVFIEFCSLPLSFNHSICDLFTKLLFLGLGLHCLVVPIFFKAKGIGNEEGDLSFIDRVLEMGYYFAIIIIIIVYLLFRKPLFLLWK